MSNCALPAAATASSNSTLHWERARQLVRLARVCQAVGMLAWLAIAAGIGLWLASLPRAGIGWLAAAGWLAATAAIWHLLALERLWRAAGRAVRQCAACPQPALVRLWAGQTLLAALLLGLVWRGSSSRLLLAGFEGFAAATIAMAIVSAAAALWCAWQFRRDDVLARLYRPLPTLEGQCRRTWRRYVHGWWTLVLAIAVIEIAPLPHSSPRGQEIPLAGGVVASECFAEAAVIDPNS